MTNLTKEQIDSKNKANAEVFAAAKDKAVKDHIEKHKKLGSTAAVIAALTAQTKATNVQAKAIIALTQATVTSSDRVTELLDKSIDDAYPDDEDGAPLSLRVAVHGLNDQTAEIYGGDTESGIDLDIYLRHKYTGNVAGVEEIELQARLDKNHSLRQLAGLEYFDTNCTVKTGEARLHQVDKTFNSMDGNDGDSIDTLTIAKDGKLLGKVAANFKSTDGVDGDKLDVTCVDDTPEYMRYTKDHSFRKEPAHTEAAKNALKVGKILASVGGYDGSRIDVSYAASAGDFTRGGIGVTPISDAPKNDYLRFVDTVVSNEDVLNLAFLAAKNAADVETVKAIRLKGNTSPNETRKSFFYLTLLNFGAHRTYDRMKDQDRYPHRVTPAELLELGGCLLRIGRDHAYIRTAMISASVYPKSQSDIGISACTVNAYMRDSISKLDGKGQEQLYVQFVSDVVEAAYGVVVS